VITVPAGQITFVEAVQLRVNITHMFDGDLGIELILPNSGTRQRAEEHRGRLLRRR